MKRIFVVCCALLCLSLLVSALWARWNENGEFRTRLTKDGSGIAGTLPPADYERRELEALPPVPPGPRQPFQVELLGYDLSKLDLKTRLADLLLADFDNRTKWPADLPAGFDPAAIMEMGKNPALGVRALHQQGITGKGVGIAIIDQGLLVDHVEYKDRLRLYEEIHCIDAEAALHGSAVSSIAVGKTVGVAPDADLYYVAASSFLDESVQNQDQPNPQMDYAVIAKAIDRILEINRQLPKEKKIRVISISLGWMPGTCGYQEVTEAVERAKQEGVFVISTALESTHGLRFMGLGRDPQGDPDKPTSYSASSWYKIYLDLTPVQPMLLLPMDSRATASPTGVTDYAFYRTGGMSWAVPYVAGLYALACQVHPEVTPQQFWAKALETGDVVEVMDQQIPDPDGTAAKRVAEQVEGAVASFKARAEGEELERDLARFYSNFTGQTREKMSEADFRTWAIETFTIMSRGDGKQHRLGMIANPARLLESLRQ